MEKPDEQSDETDHTLFEFIKMWAGLILLSLESFDDSKQTDGKKPDHRKK